MIYQSKHLFFIIKSLNLEEINGYCLIFHALKTTGIDNLIP